MSVICALFEHHRQTHNLKLISAICDLLVGLVHHSVQVKCFWQNTVVTVEPMNGKIVDVAYIIFIEMAQNKVFRRKKTGNKKVTAETKMKKS